MKRLESLVCLFVTLVEKRGSILDFYRSLDSRLRENDRKGNGNDIWPTVLLLPVLPSVFFRVIPWLCFFFFPAPTIFLSWAFDQYLRKPLQTMGI